MTQTGKQVRPVGQVAFGGDRRDEDADGRADQGRSVANGAQALGLDELRHFAWELVQVGAHVVLEDQSGERSGRFICDGQSSGDECKQLAGQAPVSHRE